MQQHVATPVENVARLLLPPTQILEQPIRGLERDRIEKPMKTLRQFIAVLAVAVATVAFTTPKAEAVLISGGMTFFGTVDLDADPVATATRVDAWFGIGGVGVPIVGSADGSFTGLSGSAVTFVAPWSFTSGPIDNFWSVGGFTFDLTSSVQTAAPAGFVTASGIGVVSKAGFEDTLMTWSFTTQDPSAGVPAVFSFSASGRAVPDGGSILALLGMTLIGVEGLRRKLLA
jgi:hypothetical protein